MIKFTNNRVIQVYFLYRSYGALNSLDTEHFYMNVVSKIVQPVFKRLKRSKLINAKKPQYIGKHDTVINTLMNSS